MERKNQNEQLTDDTMQGVYGKVDADGGQETDMIQDGNGYRVNNGGERKKKENENKKMISKVCHGIFTHPTSFALVF